MRARSGLAVASGVLLAFSFPKFGHWAVAWVALVPLLLALPGARGRQAFGLGWLAGFVSSVGLLYWTALVVSHFGGLPLAVAVPLMLLLCAVVALFPALFAWLVARWFSAFGRVALLLAPLAWVATEVLRAYTFYRFPWCLLGYSQQPDLPMIQIASVAAVYGVSFLVAGTSAAIAYAWREPVRSRRLGALAVLAAVLGGVGLLGTRRLAQPLEVTDHVRVGLVQASILQDDKWEPGKAWDNVERHVVLTRRAAAAGATLVVWPESAVPFYYDYTPPAALRLQDLAREQGVALLFGNDDLEASAPGARAWVGAKLLTSRGELAFRYHKIRLVPFGEYVPMKPLLTLGGRFAAKLVREVSDFAPGEEFSVGRVDGHSFGAFICYEAIFPDLVREFASRGAELLVNLTNDGWYGRTSAPYQHFAMAAFRAVENGRTLLRAANTGITAIVDPRGRVLARTALFEPTVVVGDAPIAAGSTFYARHGDVFAWTCFAVAAALSLVPRRSGTIQISEA